MYMKKVLGILGLLVSASLFAGDIKVGASPVPHAELLNMVKDDLKVQGVNLIVIEMTDYVTPNLAVDSKEIDANFFQHKPYMDTFIEEKGLKLVSIGNVHVEPLGVYSKKIKSLDELKKGASIAIPSDPTNGGRALILLHNNGIIKLKDPTNLLATEFDIIDNPKKIKFNAIESAGIPRVLDDVDAAVINGNYALEAGLNPNKNAIILEGKESPYANLVTVKEGRENEEDLQKLIKALQSEKVKTYILEKYDGAVVPAF
ncbi:MetQ/NlpA family ABC transporter substrate-binding protein [Cetobacterium sp. 2A]|nr:MetQ/NlpA family ABC transporter substrate-binding protein [Cetobacterium sp. 2A]